MVKRKNRAKTNLPKELGPSEEGTSPDVDVLGVNSIAFDDTATLAAGGSREEVIVLSRLVLGIKYEQAVDNEQCETLNRIRQGIEAVRDLNIRNERMFQEMLSTRNRIIMSISTRSLACLEVPKESNLKNQV